MQAPTQDFPNKTLVHNSTHRVYMIKQIIYRNSAPGTGSQKCASDNKNRVLSLGGNGEQCLSGLLEGFRMKIYSNLEAKTKNDRTF